MLIVLFENDAHVHMGLNFFISEKSNGDGNMINSDISKDQKYVMNRQNCQKRQMVAGYTQQ